MANHRKSQKGSPTHKGRKDFVEHFNVRPELETECPPPLGQTAMDVIKEEINAEAEFNFVELDIEALLTDKAQALYRTKLTSTVEEYWQSTTDPETFRLAEPSKLTVVKGKPPVMYRDPPGFDRKASLIRYMCKQVPLDRGEFPPSFTIRWANVLNYLAESGIWQFGTLMRAHYAPFPATQHGNLSAVMLSELKDERDPRVFRAVEAYQPSSALVLTYVGVHPKFKENEDINAALRLPSPLFVDEGGAGDDNWIGLP